MGLGVAIGAITFSGSVIAFLKLNGNMSGQADHAARRAMSSISACSSASSALVGYFTHGSGAVGVLDDHRARASLIGFLLIIPIGGADMPVVVSMLNSYSGWAAAAMGFTLHNTAMIITGALVGSSGAILSYIMCRAMNRSFISRDRRRLRRGRRRRRRRTKDRPAVEARLGRGCGVPDEPGRAGHHRPRLRHGGRAGAARAARNGRQAEGRGRPRQICDPPGRGPHAGAHERAARRSQRAL